jgi:hypothetical protein
VPIKLQPYEKAESVAIVPDAQRFVLGGDYQLRLLDQLGHNVWPSEQFAPGATVHVNVTGNRRLIVAAYDDGTIRWHRLADGKELLALFTTARLISTQFHNSATASIVPM